MNTWRNDPECEENQQATRASHLEVRRLQEAQRLLKFWRNQDDEECAKQEDSE